MIRLVLLISLVLLTTACNRTTYTWNQRMTVTVATPNGIVSGSSVVEIDVTVFPNGEFMTNRTASFSYRGEAVAVEIAPGQWLFALLDEYPGILLHHAGGEALFGDTHWREYGAWMPDIPRATTPMTLPRENWPRLVTFADIAVPASVEAVDADNLAATFGEGVRLVEVTLEVTRDEASMTNIDTILLWRCDYLDPYRRLDGRSGPISGNSLAERLGPGSFSLAECG